MNLITRYWLTCLAGAGALMLSACGDNTQTMIVTDPLTGEQVRIAAGDNVAAPLDLPDFAPLYPGARIEQVMGTTAAAAAGLDRGGMIAFRSSDSPERVADYYRQRLDVSGLSERTEDMIDGTHILVAGSDDFSSNVRLTIARHESGRGSYVAMVYSTPG